MSFCKFSTELVLTNKVDIDNIFFEEFMPYAPENCVKIYLYGLYLAKNNLEIDNTFEKFAKKLNISENELEDAFRYWEEQGLVQVLSTYPIQVLYKPLKDVISSNRLFKTDKYEVFNQQAQELFNGKRQITKTEYGEYYEFLEESHMEQAALIMIMNYCLESKQRAVGYNYILTVARNWAKDGILTVKDVEEKLCHITGTFAKLEKILSCLGLKRNSFIEEREMYEKWTSGMGFEDETILYVAKSLKKKGGMEKLNKTLEKYFILGLTSQKEIDAYLENKDEIYSLAKQINKNLGLYYESLDSEVETYITPWLNMGFETETLVDLSQYAFKCSIRSLENFNTLVQKLYKLGVLTKEALSEYLESVVSEDDQIKKLLQTLGLSRRVNAFDRESFKTWSQQWGFDYSIIEYAASLSANKLSPFPYMARLLSTWHDKGVKTLEDAKKQTSSIEPQPLKSQIKGRSYSKSDYEALFQSIDEIEV